MNTLAASSHTSSRFASRTTPSSWGGTYKATGLMLSANLITLGHAFGISDSKAPQPPHTYHHNNLHRRPASTTSPDPWIVIGSFRAATLTSLPLPSWTIGHLLPQLKSPYCPPPSATYLNPTRKVYLNPGATPRSLNSPSRNRTWIHGAALSGRPPRLGAWHYISKSQSYWRPSQPPMAHSTLQRAHPLQTDPRNRGYCTWQNRYMPCSQRASTLHNAHSRSNSPAVKDAINT